MSKAIENLQAAQHRAMVIRPKVGGFPYLAEALRQAGVTRNFWFLPSCQSLYLTNEGAVVTQGAPLLSGTADVPPFDREALIKALRTDQAGESTFPEFLAASWRAGVIRYDVDFGARRLHRTFLFSKGVQMGAFAVFIGANALQIWAMAVNIFFSTALRLQLERGHRLVRSGPYRYVRHPGYLAMLLIVLSTPFALGSKLALAPATIYAGLILFRAMREDRFLLRNLPDYADYTEEAPYRLIPGVW